MSDVETLRQERDFYLRMLQLDEQEDFSGLLAEALSLVVEITGARKGYIELLGTEGEVPAFSMARGCSPEEVADIQRQISSGIIAEAMATGETIETASAMGDVRFSGQASVQLNRIEAVLCVPVGEPAMGVVYLQGSRRGLEFGAEDRSRVEHFARHLAPRADRLFSRLRDDATRSARAGLVDAEGIIGRSAALSEVLTQVRQIAPLDITVMLSGPTGTGKTAIAGLIHRNSRRARGPFLELNCANISAELAESELFGAARGAHSTAVRATTGKVTEARGGTLFLDEVTELSLPVQAKLLQLLQSKIYYPLGEPQPRTADVRIIAASNRDLREAVRAGDFREDLMYRLDVFSIAMPGLDQRRVDIPLLAEHFVEQTAAEHGLAALPLSLAARSALLMAPLPGNIRELANLIQSALVRAATTGAAQITPAHFAIPQVTSASPAPLSFQDATLRFQRQLLEDTLGQNGWNVAQTARQLELARSHLYTLIKQHGLQRQD